jgi:hypothetical protein
MGFNWSSFGAGFAKAASEDIVKEEENAKILAAANVKSMYENYAAVVKENRTLSNDIKEKINVIRGFAPDATDDQLVALAQDRGILDMLSTRLKDKDFDPTGFNINNFVRVTNASGSPLTAEDRINQLFTIPAAVNSASAAFKSIKPEGEAKETPSFLSNFSLTDMAKRAGERGGKISAERTAAALGVPLEKLQGAMGYKRDIKPSGAEYDLTSLKGRKSFAESKDSAQLDMMDAKNALDKDPTDAASLKRLANATSQVATLVVIENMGKAQAKKTEDDIRTDLTNKILDPKTSPADKEAAALELEQRQKLLGKGDAEAAIQTDLINRIQDPKTSKEEAAKLKVTLNERRDLLAKDVPESKVTQTNYIAIASRAVASAVTEALPPGSLTTTVNADGTVQMMPSDLVKGPRFTSAINAAKAGVAKQFTDKDGMPKSEFHKNALISVNIMPDDQGRFIAAPETPAPAPSLVTRPAPRSAAPAAPAASIRPAGVRLTPAQEADVVKAEAAIAQGAPVAEVKKRLRDSGIPGF